jgi:protein O-GlcNAc transferase
MSLALTSPFEAGLAALAAQRPAEALPSLRTALQRGEGGALAELNLALALVALGRMAEALSHLRAAAEALPGHPEPSFQLGLIAARQGDTTAAIHHLQTALRCNPRHVPAMAALSAIREAQGEADVARALIAEARAVEPDEPELQVAAARLALAGNDAEEAIRLARAVLTERACHVAAARILASAFLRRHSPAAALALAETEAKAEPLSPAWALVAAAIWSLVPDAEKALAELRVAEALAPDDVEIQAELSRVLARLGRVEEAEAALRFVVERKPHDLDLRNLLSTLLWKRHRYGEMAAMLQQAIADFGPHAALNMNLALVLNAQGRQAEALAAAEAAVTQAGGGLGALVNRMAVLPYHPLRGNARELLRTGHDIARQLGAPQPPRLARRSGQERLRVGLLSGGLGVHPVGWLTLAGLEQLPESEFDILAYSLKPRSDHLNARFRARAAAWHEVGELDDADLAARIAADKIDILLEMGGYGEGGRPFVLHHRPAPVQIKWVGSQFSTTGLPCVDWLLTDHWETPAGFECFYTEKLLRMPDGYACYLPPIAAPEPGPLPALSRGHVTFGCLNNLAKVTPAVLATWAALLRRVPAARLLVRSHALADVPTRRLAEARMAEAGLPLERVELLGGAPHAEFIRSYQDIDIALDPFPYTGGLSVCEALWMGVPVVSLAGDSFAARHALSHLSNVGLGDWVANDVEGYLLLTEQAAADLASLARLRAGLRARVAASPLCDAPRFGRNLAAALRLAWSSAA